MTDLAARVDQLLEAPLYGWSQAEKERELAPVLAALTAHHRAACPAYRRLTDVLWPGGSVGGLVDVPWLPVGLFKSHRLVSVPHDQVTTTLTSSGTTGQVPSRIALDPATSRRQTRALARILTHVLGPRRLPMLVVDTKSLLKDRAAFSARGAGVLGMMTFGSQPVFLLDDDMRLDRAALEGFLAKHGGAPFLIFGFTFLVWAHFHEAVAGSGLDLSQGTLIHSGGWKKLLDRAVDNAVFKASLEQGTGLRRVYDFYGMVEQVGSVFLEGEDGLLYPPAFADVIVRDPLTLAEVPTGTPGVIQVLSALPTSYPGHSLLTEDLGVVVHVDGGTCGRSGKAFRVLGRLPRAELRGCSDTHAAQVSP